MELSDSEGVSAADKSEGENGRTSRDQFCFRWPEAWKLAAGREWSLAAWQDPGLPALFRNISEKVFTPVIDGIIHGIHSIWRFPERGVPLKSSILMGFSIKNIQKPSVLVYPHLWKPPFVVTSRYEGDPHQGWTQNVPRHPKHMEVS